MTSEPHNDAPSSEPAPPSQTGSSGPSADVLKAAMKAFKKRLKLTQLDHDSRIGRSPMSSGHTTIAGITPPDQYPPDVWKTLVEQGKLQRTGYGTYALRG